MAGASIILSVASKIGPGGFASLQAAGQIIASLGRRVAAFVAEQDRFAEVFAATAMNVGEATQRTKGLIKQMDLMTTANRMAAAVVKLSSSEYATLAVRAERLADATGGDAAAEFDKLTDAVIRGTSRGLKPYGIEISNTGSLADKQREAIEKLTAGFETQQSTIDNTSDALEALGNSLQSSFGLLWKEFTAASAVTRIFTTMAKGASTLNWALNQFHGNLFSWATSWETHAIILRGDWDALAVSMRRAFDEGARLKAQAAYLSTTAAGKRRQAGEREERMAYKLGLAEPTLVWGEEATAAWEEAIEQPGGGGGGGGGRTKAKEPTAEEIAAGKSAAWKEKSAGMAREDLRERMADKVRFMQEQEEIERKRFEELVRQEQQLNKMRAGFRLDEEDFLIRTKQMRPEETTLKGMDRVIYLEQYAHEQRMEQLSREMDLAYSFGQAWQSVWSEQKRGQALATGSMQMFHSVTERGLRALYTGQKNIAEMMRAMVADELMTLGIKWSIMAIGHSGEAIYNLVSIYGSKSQGMAALKAAAVYTAAAAAAISASRMLSASVHGAGAGMSNRAAGASAGGGGYGGAVGGAPSGGGGGPTQIEVTINLDGEVIHTSTINHEARAKRAGLPTIGRAA